MQYSNSSSAFKPYNSNMKTQTEKKSFDLTLSDLVDYNRTEDEIYIDEKLLEFWNKIDQNLSRESIKEYVRTIMTSLFCQKHVNKWSERVVSYLFIMWGETRDCRGNVTGKGWRDGSHWLLIELLNYFPKTALEIVGLYPVFGSWKDLQKLFEIIKSDMKQLHCNFSKLRMVENKIYSMWHTQLLEDKRILDSTYPGDTRDISFCVKYVPKEGKRLDKMYKVTKKLAARMFPLDTNPITKALKLFRKFCSPLNKAIHTTERLMCAKRYSEIDFNNVPEKCLHKNVKAFRYDKVLNVQFPDIDRIKASENYLKYLTELNSKKTKLKDIQQNKNRYQISDVNSWEVFEKTMNDERYHPIFELLEKVKESPYLLNYKAPKLSLSKEDINVTEYYKNMSTIELKNELKKVEAMMRSLQNKLENSQ